VHTESGRSHVAGESCAIQINVAEESTARRLVDMRDNGSIPTALPFSIFQTANQQLVPQGIDIGATVVENARQIVEDVDRLQAGVIIEIGVLDTVQQP
jgi:hypothetical protein